MSLNILLLTVVLGLSLFIILLIVSSLSKENKNATRQFGILTDELNHQKKENFILRTEIKRINSLDNLFLASIIRLTSRLNPIEIATETVELLINYLQAKEVVFFLLDEKGKRLNIVAHQGLNENWLPRIIYNVGEGKVGITAEKRIPLGENEFQIIGIDEPYPIFNPNLCYPLVYQDKNFGVIAITRKKRFEEREKNLLGVVSKISAIALNNILTFITLQDFASTDRLTKLYNIGFFKDKLLEEIYRARRFQYDLSIVIIDLDNFKAYNDTYGHQSGDQILIKSAEIFKRCFRNTDTIARYGGDEFIIMCSKTKKSETAKIVEKLMRDLETQDFAHYKDNRMITLSAGIASFPDDGTTISELIKSADEALYEAKGAGRNTIKLHRHKIERI